jgi:hypothetical protein
MTTSVRDYWGVRKLKSSMGLNLDTDRDGVPDCRDCRPFDPKRQHIFSKKRYNHDYQRLNDDIETMYLKEEEPEDYEIQMMEMWDAVERGPDEPPKKKKLPPLAQYEKFELE